MKRPQRFTNVHPDDAEREELYWDGKLLEDDSIYHARRTDRHSSRSKAKAKKIQSKSTRNTQEDDFVED
jgi:hypothetical protein